MKDPIIPNVPASLPPDQAAFFKSMKMAVEFIMGQGRTPDPDRALRVKELESLGIDVSKFLGSSSKNPYVINDQAAVTGDAPAPPTDLSVSKGAFHHTLTWTNPTDSIVWYIEVWVAGGSQSRDDAVLAGIYTVIDTARGDAGIYKHSGFDITHDQVYWIRSRSYGNRYSTWCPPDAQGGYLVEGDDSVQETVTKVLEILQGSITENQLYKALKDKIDLIDTSGTGILDRLASLETAIDDIPLFDSSSTYALDAIVKYDPGTGTKIYICIQAITATPAPAPTNAAYWEAIGESSSLAGNIANNASALSLLDTRVTDNKGDITAQASSISALQTSVGNNAAAINSEAVTRASEDASLASNITTGIAEAKAYTETWAIQDYNPYFENGVEFWSADVSAIVTGQGSWGSNVLSFSTMMYTASMIFMPVDTTKTYKGRIRIRQTVDPTTPGTSDILVGLAPYDESKSYIMPEPGGDGPLLNFIADNEPITVADGWLIFEGRISGVGLNANNFRPGTAYITLFFYGNYMSGDGTYQVDGFEFYEDIAATNGIEDGADVTENSAAFQAEQTARADGDSANASAINTVQTTVNGHTTAIQETSESIDGISGKYSVKVDNNGYVSGFGLISEDNDGAVVSEFILLVDKFKVVTPGKTPQVPFAIGTVDGVSTVGINGALVVDGTIASPAIQADAIKAAHIDVSELFVGMSLQSTDFISGLQGWKMYGNGLLEMYGGVISIAAGSTGYGNLSDAPAEEDIMNNRLENGVGYIQAPIGGSNRFQGASTGVIKVTLPQSWTNTMVRFSISVYNYSTNTSMTLYVGGYTHLTGASWYNVFADILGNTGGDNRVRFGHDGSKCAVYVGELTSSWSYVSVTINDVQVSHSNYELSKWGAGWAISIESSIAGTVSSDISDATIDAKASWANVYGTGKPEDSATAGATWGANLINQPTSLENINPTEWSYVIDPAGRINSHTTTISGGKIATYSMHANRLISYSITTLQLAANAVKANNIDVVNLQAVSAIMGNLSVNSTLTILNKYGKIVAGKTSFDSTSAGFYLGARGSAYPGQYVFHIGSGASYLKANNGDLEYTGKLGGALVGNAIEARTDNDVSYPGYYSWTETVAFNIGRGGAFRIKWEAYQINSRWTKSKVYRNGSPVGSEMTLSGSGSDWYSLSEDIGGWSQGDRLSIYTCSQYSAYRTSIRNVKICSSNSPVTTLY